MLVNINNLKIYPFQMIIIYILYKLYKNNLIKIWYIL